MSVLRVRRPSDASVATLVQPKPGFRCTALVSTARCLQPHCALPRRTSDVVISASQGRAPSKTRPLHIYSSLLQAPSDQASLRIHPLNAAAHRVLSFSTLSQCGRPAMPAAAATGKLDDKVSPKHIVRLPDDHVSLREVCAVLHDNITSFLNSDPPTELLRNVQRQTEISLGVLQNGLEKYGFNALALSYNGGKDCLVLLILWLVTLYKHYGQPRNATSTPVADGNSAPHFDPFPDSIESVYVRAPNAFAEVDDFVRKSANQYRLNLTTQLEPMKFAFEKYLAQKPRIEAIFVGTRRTDPHGHTLTHFAPTDGDWPGFMRCHPVLDWNYREIWAFIRHFEIAYCPLYDKGYTSLGGTNDTYPNPKLLLEVGEEGKALYGPAYELMEDDEERLGRT